MEKERSTQWLSKLYCIVGHKSRLLDIIVPKIGKQVLKQLNDSATDYIEPFCGSGVVFTNVLKYVIDKRMGEGKHEKMSELRVHIYDVDEYIIDFWNTLLNIRQTASMIELMKKLSKNILRARNREEVAECYYKLRDKLNSSRVRNSERWIRAAYYMTVLRFCFGNMPNYNANGDFVSSTGRKTRSCFDSVINESDVWGVHELLTNKKLHEMAGLKIRLAFTRSDVKNTVKRICSRKDIANAVVYMDPPYTDTASVYGKSDKITVMVNESVDELMTFWYTEGMKPVLFMSNNVVYKNNWCKYRLKININSTHNQRHVKRSEVLISNRSLGTQLVYDI